MFKSGDLDLQQTVCPCRLRPGFQGSLRLLSEIAGRVRRDSREQKDINSRLGAETTVPLLGKQQDYGFNITKVTEIRNLALLHLSLSVRYYTPSHSLILSQILQPLDQSFHQVLKFIHRDFATIFQRFFFPFALWTSLLLLAMCVGTSPGDLSVNPPKSQNLQFLVQCKAKL